MVPIVMSVFGNRFTLSRKTEWTDARVGHFTSHQDFTDDIFSVADLIALPKGRA